MARPRKNVDTLVVVETPVESDQPAATPDEIAAAVEFIRQRRNTLPAGTQSPTDASAQQSLANALIQAIEATRPPSKKTVSNRKRFASQPHLQGPKLKLKRTIMQHGIEIDPVYETNEVIELLNKIKPGKYCQGHIHVIKRKDGAYDISYPVRTAAQRLKIVNQFHITDFKSLLNRLVDERNDPTKYRRPDDEDDD